MRIVFISGRYIHAGRHRKWAGLFPSARQAELAAAFAGQGHTPVLLADADVHLPIDIARLAWRQDPDAVVVCGDSVPAAVVAALRTSPVAVVVTTAGLPPALGAVHHSDVAAVLAAAGAPDPSGSRPAVGIDPGVRAEVVPPALRAEVGVELARRDPDGVVRGNEPAVVAQSLVSAQVAAAESSRPIRLWGTEDLVEAEAVLHLAAVADRLDGPLAASLRVRATEASPAVAAVAARVVRSACLEVRDHDDVAALRQAIGAFEQTGLDISVFAHFDDDREMVEDVADIVLAAGVELSYVWMEATDPGVVLDGDRILAETGSSTLAEQAALGPFGPLASLFSGRFAAAVGTAAIEAVLVTADPPPAGIEAAGLRTEIFSASGPVGGSGRPWLFEPVALSGPPLAGDGEVRLDGLTFETSGYRQGRHVTPFESLVLRFGDLEDIEAFVADADAARRHGRFPAALLSGFTLLSDSCAWGPAGECHSGQLRRAACTDGRHIRTAPHGPVVGDAGQPWVELARAARQEVASAKRRRGCRDCPIAALCSKDLCLSSLITDEQYCGARQARPWLAGYLDVIDAIRKVRGDPAQVVPRVGGYGGPIHNDLAAGSWPDRPALVLMEWQGGFYGYAPASQQAFRLTPDTAFIAEALMVCSGPGQAAGAVEAHYGLTAEQARVAINRVERLLGQRGAAVAQVGPLCQAGERP